MLDMPLQLCSMIEIEVEMASDVIVAEAASSAVSSSYLAILFMHHVDEVWLLIISVLIPGKDIRTNTATNGDW